ncbi:MAG TPA: CHASE3 domain-containing protein [Bryobacteraceae bacterium]|jgi:CHASE3 domain sensor protein|nr:CHASE3 domain-containing protein [Bryobacteraceae bacterium]
MSGKIRTGATLVILISAVVVLALAVREYRRDGAAIQRLYTRSVKKHDIVEAARNALSALADAEIREQNYVLTGETIYSEAYAEDLRDWQDEYGALELVATKDPATPVVKDFSQAGTRALNELALIISVYEKTGRDAALERIRKGAGTVYLDQARSSVATIAEIDGGAADLTRTIILSALSAIRRLAVAAGLLFLLAAIAASLLFVSARRTP